MRWRLGIWIEMQYACTAASCRLDPGAPCSHICGHCDGYCVALKGSAFGSVTAIGNTLGNDKRKKRNENRKMGIATACLEHCFQQMKGFLCLSIWKRGICGLLTAGGWSACKVPYETSGGTAEHKAGRLLIFLKRGDMRIDVGETSVYIARTMKLRGTFICFAYTASLY
ncbi:hypothetical protein K505DRAFT_104249 [Melanomma pulvis-pyrius CBS 109.77]|uniref:Uncharacterized protein n=1 Tax=Melanomma pulvis-pyrius CBS 109.77 TaxID=1314802 RepID=A0A6A6WXS3_9PLEO|nr:hypothetical protein K505DRAFT_104249 [Melanomma pulvis-pyrius CBS 109.77]